ncbi:MAG TPA: hypothetical protein VD929_02420 [Caulobacteraceae bacterium]|nr:hypothetical protein [Caulobacteraceae bacterium]
MKRTVLAAVAAVAAVIAAAPASAQSWRDMAQRDLQAAHDILRDNSPAAVMDQGGQFRSWLDAGLQQSLANVGEVRGQLGYENAMRGYLTGFRDPNISYVGGVAPLAHWYSIAWPGFATRWNNGSYVVGWSRGGSKLPPVGAKLVSCDKVPAEQIAMKRLDRWEGDLTQASDRARTAPILLWDRANPFAGMPPQKCVFEVGKGKKTYTLEYLATAEAERRQAWEAAIGRPAAPTVEAWGDGRHWIRVPSFAEGPAFDGFLTQLDAVLPAVQASSTIVLDLRGADDGAVSRNGYRLANRIWGPEFVVKNHPQVGNAAYRVSPMNRAVYAEGLERIRKDWQLYTQAPVLEKLLAEFDAALAANQPLIQRNETRTVADDQTGPATQAKVVVLTDHFCAAQCLAMLDQFMRLPKVTHVGAPTSGDTIFISQTLAPLPSTNGYVAFGNKAWLDRARPTGKGHTPSAVYTGDWADEAAVRAFVEAAAAR